MKTTDTYMFDSTDIEAVRVKLEIVLNRQFIPHDSYHYGNYYLIKGGECTGESLMLCQNIEFEGELHYPALPSGCILLTVGSTAVAAKWQSVFEGLGAKRIEHKQHD